MSHTVKRCRMCGQEHGLAAVHCDVDFEPLHYWCIACREWLPAPTCPKCGDARCPKCDFVAPLPEMRQHIWQAHRLILDGRVARGARTVVEKRIEQYVKDGDRGALLEAQAVTDQAGAEAGIAPVVQTVLRRGVRDEALQQILEHAAAAARVTVCGACFEFIPSRVGATMPVVIEADGSLVCDAYAIDIARSRFWLRATITSRSGGTAVDIAKSGPTRLGAALLAGAIPLLAMLLLLTVVEAMHLSPLAFAFFMIWASIVLAAGTWLNCRPTLGTAVDVAWHAIVPELLKKGPNAANSAFLAGLAAVSENRGDARSRVSVTARAIDAATSWSADHAFAHHCSAALHRLSVSDHLHLGQPARVVRRLRQLLEFCASGALPLSSLDIATDDGAWVERLPVGCRLALRVMVCEVYLKSGSNPAAIMALGERSRAISTILGGSPLTSKLDVARMAALVEFAPLICSLNGATVFDLTERGDFDAMEQNRDLLAIAKHDSIAVTVRGILFRGDLYTSRLTITSRELTQFVQTGWTYQRVDGGPDMRYRENPPVGYYRVVGHELAIGGQTYSCSAPPAALVQRLQAWSDLCFGKLTSRATQLANQPPVAPRPAPTPTATVRCPNCGRSSGFVEGRVAALIADVL